MILSAHSEHHFGTCVEDRFAPQSHLAGREDCLPLRSMDDLTMRAPKRKRPVRRQIAGPVAGMDLHEIARRVSYIGSPEHEETPSFAGQPRADASVCDRRLAQDREQVTEWLRTAIQRGAMSRLFEGAFPRYAWYKDGTVVYEARLVNRELGEYKGYPLNDTEWPEALGSVYE